MRLRRNEGTMRLSFIFPNHVKAAGSSCRVAILERRMMSFGEMIFDISMAAITPKLKPDNDKFFACVYKCHHTPAIMWQRFIALRWQPGKMANVPFRWQRQPLKYALIGTKTGNEIKCHCLTSPPSKTAFSPAAR